MAAAAVTVTRWRFERQLAHEIDALLAERSNSRPAPITAADLAGLPEPVQRWLRTAAVFGTTRPSSIRLKYSGDFRLAEGQPWIPFDAEEYYTTDPPGFIWAPRMRLLRLLPIIGADRYFQGVGSLQMRLLGVVPLNEQTGGALNQGAMLRYLSEIMWFPAVALSPYITWESAGATAATATISNGGLAASSTFMFDEQGRLTSIVGRRYNSITKRLEAWSTPIHAYGAFNGVTVPVEVEGIWNYESGDFPFIRLRLSQLQYDRPERY